MKDGTLPALAGGLLDQAANSNNVKITGKDWQTMFQGDVFVWMDYISVPQLGDSQTEEDAGDLASAVNSIPAYIERSTHFIALAPTIEHTDLPGTYCDQNSWLTRGWCRVEFCSLLLAMNHQVPAIVVKGSSVPSMMSGVSAISRPPGLGEYTCCKR